MVEIFFDVHKRRLICSGIKIIRFYPSFYTLSRFFLFSSLLPFFFFFFFKLSEKKNLNSLVSVGRAAEEPRFRVYLFNHIFFNGEGKYSTNLEMFPVKSRFTDGNRGKYYFHKLGRYGGSFFTWLVRIYSTTVAGNRSKVLGRRENEGRIARPRNGIRFFAGPPENSMLRSLYLCMYIYISQCQPRNVYGDRIRISTPLGMTHPYTQ